MISFVIFCSLLSFTVPSLAFEDGKIPCSSKNKHRRITVTAMDKSRRSLDEFTAIIDIDEWSRMPCFIAKDIAAGNNVCVMIVNGFAFRGI